MVKFKLENDEMQKGHDQHLWSILLRFGSYLCNLYTKVLLCDLCGIGSYDWVIQISLILAHSIVLYGGESLEWMAIT